MSVASSSTAVRPFAGRWTFGSFALFWLALLAAPALSPNDYLTSLAATFLVNVLLVASLNLFVGVSGQISLAHAAFFGIGAYVSGFLSARTGVPPWASVALATLVTGAAAAILGWPTLRLRGHYLAMATLGFNVIVYTLLVGLVDVTGGPNGLGGIPSFAIAGTLFDTPERFYYVAWLAAGLIMIGLLNLLRSRAGLALRALGMSEVAAASSGVSVARYKISAFALSAAIAGLAGALYAHQNNYLTPETFSFFNSVLILVMTAVGGLGYFWGGIIGAALYTFAPELVSAFPDVELLLFGVLMIVTVGFLPSGIAGAIGKLAKLRA